MIFSKKNNFSSYLLLLFLSVFFIGILFFSPHQAKSFEEVTQNFKVSAYYSPIPGQKKYVSGSYAADIRMNGNGTNGADGTPVQAGMISAPRKYAFGTKIFLPGLGIGTVHDRGGAIVAGKNYEKLDIWMGYGDAGRIRAITWGSKIVSGKIIDPSIPQTIRFSENSTKSSSDFSSAEIPRTKIQNTNSTSSQKKFFTPLQKEDENNEVQRVQKFLRDKNFFSGTTTQYFGNKTFEAIYQFQKHHHIVSSRSDDGAGIWGPKTRKKANTLFSSTQSIQNKKIVSQKFFTSLQKEDENNEVQRIQKFLRDKKFFSGTTTQYFGNKTFEAVYQFQKHHHIVFSRSDDGAGVWGPKTRKKANTLL